MDEALSGLMQTFSSKPEPIELPKTGASPSDVGEQVDLTIMALLSQDSLSLGQLELLKVLLSRRVTT